MKKLCCIITVFSLVMGLAACSKAEKDIRGTVQTEPAETEPEFAVGSAQNNTYTNSFLGLTVTLGGDWQFASDEEIREINQIAQDMVGEDYAKAMQEADVVQDMYAANQANGATANIVLTNMGNMGGLLVSEDMVAEQSMEEISTAMGNVGVENLTVEKTQMVFAGQEHPALTVKGTISGLNLFETIVIMKHGRYMVNITAASYMEDTTMDVLNAFRVIK